MKEGKIKKAIRSAARQKLYKHDEQQCIIYAALVYFLAFISVKAGFLPWQIFGVLVLIVTAAIYFLYQNDTRKYTRASIPEIDAMSGTEFEQYLKTYFEQNGYTVRLTQDSHDYGVDMILKKKMRNGNKITVAVQAKHYRSNVGISAVQQVIAGMRFYDCTKAMVVTNRYFTKSAVQLAEANQVVLWDRERLFHNKNKS